MLQTNFYFLSRGQINYRLLHKTKNRKCSFSISSGVGTPHTNHFEMRFLFCTRPFHVSSVKNEYEIGFQFCHDSVCFDPDLFFAISKRNTDFSALLILALFSIHHCTKIASMILVLANFLRALSWKSQTIMADCGFLSQRDNWCQVPGQVCFKKIDFLLVWFSM